MIEAINHVVAGAASPALQMTQHVDINANAPTGFAEMMTQFATSTIEKVEQAESASLAKMSGAEMPLREIVDKVMAAQQSLNTMLAIRDKIVQAYIEISHTQI